MYPTLFSHQIIIADTNFKEIKKNDIILFKENDEILIKRVKGVEGESYLASAPPCGYFLPNKYIPNSKILQEKSIEAKIIPHNYYFVLGDNSNQSLDSRCIGLVNKANVVALYK